MKNETARREIESLDYYLQNHTTDYSEESHMAMMMAIKALEKEPCEDCISREAVLDEIDKYIKKAQSTGIKDDFISFEELVVKQLPSVTPQRPQRRWIHPYKSDIACECSECHIQMPITNYYHYCPNCGAEMSGGDPK